EAMFDECASESVARVMLVTGGAGVGKSRLRHELVRRLRARGSPVEIWIGRGTPKRSGTPLDMLAQILRSAAYLRGDEPPEEQQQKLMDRVACHVDASMLARVSAFLGEIIGAPSPEQGSLHLQAARQSSALMAEQTRRAWEEFIHAECRAQP